MIRSAIHALIAVVLASSFCQTGFAADSISDFKADKVGEALVVSATGSDAKIWTNTQLLIDIDQNAKTGYQSSDLPGHGFDYMAEGETLYRFKGSDPTAWSWEKVGSAKRKTDGAKLSLSVDLAALAGDKPPADFDVVLRTLSSDYQKVFATSPAVRVGAEKNIESNPKAAGDFKADIHQDGSDLIIKVTTLKTADIDTLLIFFDTDCDASTGFQPPADPHFGFEQMIQGESLSIHTGEARDGWTWKTAGPVKRTIDGSTAEFRFNASLLKTRKFKAAVWQMSPDWQTRTDRFPADDSGTIEVTLDASKLHAEAVRSPLPFAAPRADRSLPARERFAKINSYCCYYGAGEISDLSHYGAVILHTPAQTATDIKKLNQIGVVTVGYLSVGEDDQLQVGNGKGPDGKASWYFETKNAGQPDKNGTWNSWYANANDPDWRANRVAEARRLCDSSKDGLGFDGIFLDTIETCDAYPQSRAGMVQLVIELRAALPDKVIVMNRGFSLLKENEVSSRIDGLMFESFTDSYDFDSKSYIEFAPQDLDATRQVMVTDVLPATKRYPLKVLALDYCRASQTDRIQRAFDRAVTFGMVPAMAPIFLDDVYDTTHVVGKVDEKYLSKLSSPQSLGITLNEDRNGFPAGTRIEPSSCFLGYTVAAIVDGIKDRQTLNWSKAAWASAEEPGNAQQLELKFPDSITGGTIVATFALDDGKWRTSRQLQMQAKSSDQGEWINLPVVIDSQSAKCQLPATPIHRLRIVQAAGGGCSDRPDLMWISQVQRTK